MPPKRTSQARAKPSTVSKQKKRRTSMNLEVVSPALSPDVLETITAPVTQLVTATIRDEVTTLINNINSNSASNSQGSISINSLGASNNDDNDGLVHVRESRHLDNAIQHSVEAVVVDQTEKIAGKCPTGFVSTAVPIDARVEDGDRPGKLTIHQVENDSQSEVTLSSMHDWLTAWNRFAAIYCIKYPEQQAKLAKHLESVRDIADAKGNWKAYDTDFRMLVAQGQVSWGGVHMELYVNARLTTALSSKPNTSHKDMSYSSRPRGVCFQYHSGKNCSSGLSCRFQHRCYNCGGSHPFIQCTKQAKQPFRIMQRYQNQTGSTNTGKQYNQSKSFGTSKQGPNTNQGK
uniref:C3H1-type domain-containing protein n=1 Tax=Magallana gigas TaxID=29159 RepID=A0A8W8MI15_MAGGI